jgi:ATP-dependent RNA helicase DDX54/DBP10
MVGRKRYRHNKVEASKEVDRLHVAYERKQKKLKKQAEAENANGTSANATKTNKATRPSGNTFVKSELKTADQIRKTRELKERRRAKTGRHTKATRGKRR